MLYEKNQIHLCAAAQEKKKPPLVDRVDTDLLRAFGGTENSVC